MNRPVRVHSDHSEFADHMRRNLGELVVFAVVFVVLFTVLVTVDAFDKIYNYTRTNEEMQLDELLIALLALGVTGFAFTIRRWRIEHRNAEQIGELKADVERALQQAMASDEAKSAFLANLSHELRTPLNAVIGFSQVLEHGMMGPIDARYACYATDIRESGEHLLDLINDILDIARADAEKLELQTSDIDLQALAANCIKILGVQAAGGNVQLVNDVPADFPAVVADAQRLRQILINLVGNAIKFSPRGSAVEISAHASPEAVVIQVVDRGIGMTEEDAERVLQPFVQVESDLARKYDGVGLGLALVKRLVELHGGRLKLDTALGEGTTAIVTLPQPDRHTARPAEDAPDHCLIPS